MSLRNLVLKYEEEILKLSKQGLNNSEIARRLVSEKNLNLEGTQLDSFRRAISQRMIEPSPEEGLEKVIQEKFAEEDGVDEKEVANAEEEEKELARSAYKKYKHNTDYYYDGTKDLYIVYIKNKAYNFTGTIIRDMKARYSSLTGSAESINEICRNFEIPRNIFIALKSILGWTHDSEPFTDEEMFLRDEQEMVADALQKRKFSFLSVIR